jgi:hypothetical protein
MLRNDYVSDQCTIFNDVADVLATQDMDRPPAWPFNSTEYLAHIRVVSKEILTFSETRTWMLPGTPGSEGFRPLMFVEMAAPMS